MLSPRFIPCLLLENSGLTKTVKFKPGKYIGDPINAVRIFNEKEVDELVFLDIQASKTNSRPDFQLIEDIASETFMPFAFGGGINNVEDALRIVKSGAEKVVLNSAALDQPQLISQIAEKIGSQSVCVSIDVKTNLWGRPCVFDHRKNKCLSLSPLEHAQKVCQLGAGEIFLNSVDRDGTMKGYDLALIRLITNQVSVPVIACGGAGHLDHMMAALNAGASSAAAGSFFVFHGPHKAVLITYPDRADINRPELFGNG